MSNGYAAFFAASAGASAAFIGLLFVALSFIDSSDASEKDRAWRRIMASSSFAQLTNIFFVSLIGLTPDARNLAIVACAMAVLGALVAFRLLPRTVDPSHSGRTTPSFLGLVAVVGYVIEFIAGVGLVQNPTDSSALRYLVVAMTILFAGALARAWDITGIKRR